MDAKLEMGVIKMGRRLPKLLLACALLLIINVASVSGQRAASIPIYATIDEDEILRRELEWAESTLEGYKRKNGKIPLRSSIEAEHVHTEKWKNDSLDIVQGKTNYNNLRGS